MDTRVSVPQAVDAQVPAERCVLRGKAAVVHGSDNRVVGRKVDPAVIPGPIGVFVVGEIEQVKAVIVAIGPNFHHTELPKWSAVVATGSALGYAASADGQIGVGLYDLMTTHYRERGAVGIH